MKPFHTQTSLRITKPWLDAADAIAQARNAHLSGTRQQSTRASVLRQAIRLGIEQLRDRERIPPSPAERIPPTSPGQITRTVPAPLEKPLRQPRKKNK